MCCSHNNCCCLCAFMYTVFYSCLHFLKGLALLLPLLIHEILLFSINTSICVGLTAILSFFHEICWYRPLPADVQAVLALVFLTAFGEASTLMLRSSYILKYYKKQLRQYPWITRTVTSVFGLLTVSVAVAHLYFGYKSAHPSYYMGSYISGDLRVNGDLDKVVDPETLNSTSTFVVLISLSYLTYDIPRVTDWMIYRFRMNPIDLYVQLGSKLYVGYFFMQILLLVIYAVPLLLLAFALHFVELSPVYVFPVLVLNGIGIGINVAHLENIYISRYGHMQRPNFPYENCLATRVNLFQYILVPSVAVAYYGTGPIRTLHPEGQFYLYTLLISLAAVQATKCIFTNYYKNAVNQIRRMLRDNRLRMFLQDLQEAQANADEAEIVQIEDTPEECAADLDKNANNPVPKDAAKQQSANQMLDQILENVQTEQPAPESGGDLAKPEEKPFQP